MAKIKVYYLYFNENTYQPLRNDTHSEEIKKMMNEPNGAQVLTTGLTSDNKNAT